MVKYLLQGLLFGLAYVAPIGTQNLYVINTAMRKSKKRAYQVAFLTIFFDISLAISCFFGIGFLLNVVPVLKGIILIVGSIVIIYMGVGLLRTFSQISLKENIVDSLIKVIGACFAVTWLNPQAIIDGSLLLGGFRAVLPQAMSKYFIIGVCAASFLWFNTLVTVTYIFRNKLNSVVKWINVICGLILIFYGLKLGYSFFSMLL